jgi:hypothetical protein
LGVKLASIAWPGVLAAILVAAALIFYITTIYSRRRHNLLQMAENQHNYYVITNLLTDNDDTVKKEMDKIQTSYKRRVTIAGFLLFVTIVGAAILAARPAQIIQTNERVSSRDIVLCLDVSGSTLAHDKEILLTYQSVISGFTGERIALSIFNSTSRVVFPLTNDYNLVNDKINEALKVLEPIKQDTDLSTIPQSKARDILYFLTGTTSKTDSASLIGDGLINCALQFDETADTQRSRSIIFATDNILSGSPIFSLTEAVDFATTKRNATIYGIYSGQSNMEGEENEQNMKNTILENAGLYFFAKNSNIIPTIVNEISKKQQTELNPEAKVAILDYPQLILYVLIVSFGGYLLVVWRLRQ